MTQPPRTADHAFIRAVNQAVVLDLLRRRGPISRADLAKASGLNKATISDLVARLIHDGLVGEVGMGASTGGRRPRLLTLRATAGYAVGVDLGVDAMRVVLLDLYGRVTWTRCLPHAPNASPRAVVHNLEETVDEALGIAKDAALGLLGIGVGVHGLVDHTTGRVVFAPNAGWRDVPVGQWLTERFQLPVRVDNEANAGALAEFWMGAAQDVASLVYFSIGVGLGTGLVIDGKIYRGVTGTAGELGHTTIDVTGPLCRCGNRGCLELFVSERGLLNVLGRLKPGPVPATADEVVKAADAGDPSAIAALARVGEYLGIGMGNAINTLNPQAIVIGGAMSRAGHHILNAARRVVEQRALAFPRADTRFAVSTLGADACAIGAGILILDEFFRIPGQDMHPPAAAHRAPAR